MKGGGSRLTTPERKRGSWGPGVATRVGGNTLRASRPPQEIGEPFLLVPHGASPSVSEDGTLVYVHVGPELQRLVWMDRTGQVQGTIGQAHPEITQLVLSPDEQRVAVSAPETRHGRHAIWIHDVNRHTKTRLTFSKPSELEPTWSPGGERVAFVRASGGKTAILTRSADGTGEIETLVAGSSPSFSRDGEFLAYDLRNPESGWDLWYLPLEEDPKPIPFLRTPADERDPEISPNGQYLAYRSDESGASQVYLKRFPGGEGRWQVSVDGGGCTRWSRKGDKLFYLTAGRLMEVTVSTTPPLTLGVPRELFSSADGVKLGRGCFDVAADGQRFVAVQSGDDDVDRNITVVQNWFAEFRKRRR